MFLVNRSLKAKNRVEELEQLLAAARADLGQSGSEPGECQCLRPTSSSR